MLDHDDGVAEVAQALERAEQPRVVALVQADRGLVEDVHHAGESRADLAREADALRLTARERLGGAIEGQVIEAHVGQEAQPLADLAHDRSATVARQPASCSAPKNATRLADRELRDLGDVAALNQDGARDFVEARALAFGQGRVPR